MQPFRVLEHTADVGFEAWGVSRAEVFANAACALQDLMVDLGNIQPHEEVKVEVEGEDAAALLVNWLSRIVYLFDAEGWVFHEFEAQHLEDCHLSALARGEKFDPARHAVKLQVKAVTYHQLALEQTSQGWRARIFVDI